MLKIWGRRNAFNVQKVLWLVDELGLAYAAGGDFGGLNTPEFLAMNPTGRVPVIKDGDTIVWESHAILRYLAACYGGTQFWAKEASERSQADRWMDWAQTALQPDFLNGVFRNFYRTPESQRDWPVIRKSIARCAEHFQLLNTVLEDKLFLCGDHFSLADIPAGAILYRYFEIEIERPHIPNVEMWYQRLQEREAYRKNVMVSFSELQGHLL